MRRVLATLGWVVGAVAVLALFVAAGRWSATPARWGDLGAWLDEVPPEEAVVELARWAGLAIAGYVAVVSVLVLLSELAAAARWVSLAKLLRRVGLRSAIPALRRRLVHATATTAMTVSSFAASAGVSVGAAPPPVEQVVDAAPQLAPLPSGVSPEQVSGFGVASARTLTADQVVVAPGDTLWDLTVARFGFADAALIGEIARLSGVSDPALIYAGQVITFPAQAPSAVIPPALPSVPEGAATWGVHRIVHGDTLWDILEAHYGYVDAALVWFVAEHNGLADPSDIPIGTDVWLPSPLTAPAAASPDPVQPDQVPVPDPSASPPEPVQPAAESDRLEVTSVPAIPADAGRTGDGASESTSPGDPETTSSGGVSGVDERGAGDSSTPPAPVATRPAPVRPADRDRVSARADAEVVELGAATAVSSRGALPSARWLFGSATVSTLGLVGGWVTLRRLQRRRHRWALGGKARAAEPVVAVDVAAEGDPLIGRQVDFLTALSTGGPVERPVRAVLMNSAAVEVLFVDAVDALPDGWQPDPSVNGWIHPFTDGAAEALAWLSPAAATLGHRSDPGDCEVMLDLRSAGRVAITGDELRVRSLMCSLAWELSASAMGRDVDVLLVGFACSSAEMTARPARRATLAEAVEFAASAPADGEPPRVFFVDGIDSDAAVNELIEGCVPGSGNAVVLPVPFDAAVETVHVAAERRTEWDGFTLEPYGVQPSADGELASTLSAIHIGRLQQGALDTVGALPRGGGPAGPMEDAAFGPVAEAVVELDDGFGDGFGGFGGFGGFDDRASAGELRLVPPVPGWASTGAGARVVLRTCGAPAVQGAPSTSSLAVVFLLAEGGRTMHGSEIGELTGYKPKTLSTVFTNESPLLERCDGSLTVAEHVITDHRLLAEEAAAVRAAVAAGTATGDGVWLLIDALAAIESAPYGRLPGGKAQRSWLWVDDYPEDVPARAAAEHNVVSGALDIAAASLAVDGIAEAGRSALVEELCRLARLIPYATVAADRRRVDTSGRCLIRAAYEVAGRDVTMRDAVVMHARRLVAAGLLEDPGDELADFLEL